MKLGNVPFKVKAYLVVVIYPQHLRQVAKAVLARVALLANSSFFMITQNQRHFSNKDSLTILKFFEKLRTMDSYG